MLAPLVDAVARAGALDARGLDRLVKRFPKRQDAGPGGLYSKSEIIAGFRAFGSREPVSEEEFVARLRLRPVRTLSGVTPVTVLTKPFPCPGTCVFCPSDVRMPKSYLSDEPGAQRAEDNRFDPYLQTWARLAAYRAIGHPVDKVELIVLGGTWSAYPEAYRVWFTKRCFDALNDFGAGRDGRADAGSAPADPGERPPLDGRGDATYNDVVPAALHASERAGWEDLEAAQRANEQAGARCVGLVFETRPDHVTERELLHLRRLGATRLQLGIQSTDDDRLRDSARGHDVATTRRAVALLRAAGFKLHAHWMPNLPGATPEADDRDFRRLFDDPALRPDELKIYPCLLVESAPLVRWFERGDWKPYDDETLAALLGRCIERTPRWCRLTRVVRDFSAHDVAAGTHVANLREVAERTLPRRPQEIRAREIRADDFAPADLALRATAYDVATGRELFLELVTPEDRLVAFLRLSLPAERSFVDELGHAAVVRELHVYGAARRLGSRAGQGAQHGGLGTRLLEEAATRARDAGYERLAVISAVGTRAYYRRHGFADGVLYQARTLSPRVLA